MAIFWSEVAAQLASMLPIVLAFSVIAPIPYIIAERLWPAGVPPRWQSYVLNTIIALTTLVLSTPIGMAAGLVAAKTQALIGWQPWSIPFAQFEQVPLLKGAMLMLVPLVIHDLWFYWSHRLEHRLPVLWAFHSLHHSDREMNCTTWARDHFLQSGWRAFFSVFTLGMLIDLEMKEAGQAAFLSQLALMLWSMFYHSAIKVRLPWLDRVLVTPQVHRIHHSTNPAHFNRNFADVFPLMDMIFGTYQRPGKDEFATNGLDHPQLEVGDPLSAQINPVLRALRIK